MNEPQYRLLAAGEIAEVGDECYMWKSQQWIPAYPGSIIPKDFIYRRPIIPPRWISTKERDPQLPCWVTDGKYVNHGSHEQTLPNVTHWMPAPSWPEPPKTNERGFRAP